MANRNMQQKILKMKRQRRAWAKPFSMKGRGYDPNAGYITDAGSYVSLHLGHRSKVASAQEPEVNERLKEKWLSRLFMDGYTQNSEGQFFKPGSKQSPREMVLQKIFQSTSNAGSLQSVQRFVYQKIISTRMVDLRLYMCGDDAFFVEKETKRTGEVVHRRSIMYCRLGSQSGKYIAMEAFERHKVTWLPPEEIEDASEGPPL